MAPGQGFSQFFDYSAVWKRFSELHHPKDIALAKPVAELRCQFCRQCRQNSFAVVSALFAEEFDTDAVAQIPVQQHQFTVDRYGRALPCLLNQAAQLGQQCAFRDNR